MFEYFPGNYTWSANVHVTLACGGQLGEIDAALAPLRDHEAVPDMWADTWEGLAETHERLAAAEASNAFTYAAGERLLRASMYHAAAERQMEPGERKSESYERSVHDFAEGVALARLDWEPIEVPSPDGAMPGYIVHAPDRRRPPPAMIFIDGFDGTKEMLLLLMRGIFERRNLSLVVVDTPGIGEMLRRKCVPARPDSEVSVGAIIDYLETRTEIDAERLGLMGISLGGYYAPRAAAFEDRIKCCVAWGAILDWGATWQKRWATRSPNVSVPWFQLPWVMGVDTMQAALERAKQWTLVDVLPQLRTPLLMLHGAHDRQIPKEDARRAFDLAASEDKEFRVFEHEEGNAAHVQIDAPFAARDLLADWCAQRLFPESSPLRPEAARLVLGGQS